MKSINISRSTYALTFAGALLIALTVLFAYLITVNKSATEPELILTVPTSTIATDIPTSTEDDSAVDEVRPLYEGFVSSSQEFVLNNGKTTLITHSENDYFSVVRLIPELEPYDDYNQLGSRRYSNFSELNGKIDRSERSVVVFETRAISECSRLSTATTTEGLRVTIERSPCEAYSVLNDIYFNQNGDLVQKVLRANNEHYLVRGTDRYALKAGYIDECPGEYTEEEMLPNAPGRNTKANKVTITNEATGKEKTFPVNADLACEGTYGGWMNPKLPIDAWNNSIDVAGTKILIKDLP